ncbi:MAG: hypothetical protein AMXMBFR64_32780 [Myxococcales bacterium]
MSLEGAVLITELGGRLVAAVALGEDRGTLDVLLHGGVRQKLKSDKVIRVSARRIQSPAARGAQAVAEAEAYLVRVQESLAALDMEALWEILVDDGGAWSLADLADLANPGGDTVATDAMALALWSDRVWFKARKEGLVPNPRRTVDQMRSQARAETAARDEEQGAAAEIRALLDKGETVGDPPPAAAEPWVRLLRDLALGTIEGAREKKALAILQLVLPDRQTVNAWHALDVLTRLGVFGPDQNLDLVRHKVPVAFPATVLAEAERLAARPLATGGREDLRHLVAVAIDDADTRDVDDALAVEDLPGGRTRLHVLIADASELVPLETEVGMEARRRASSLYLPDQVVPMLPPVLSEVALSLEAGVDRLVLDFRLDLDGGRVIGTEVVEGLARVAARITYVDGDAILGGAPSPFAPLLERLRGIAADLREARRRGGALLFQQTEVKVKVGSDGVRVERIDRASASRELVAETMIATCTHAAAWCHARGIPAVYRTQGAPDEPIELDPSQEDDPVAISELLRRLRKAEVSLVPDRHYTLGVDTYTQVTSPIRRFQDLVMHAQIKGALRDGVAPLGEREILHVFGELEGVSSLFSRMEREAKRYWILKHLGGRRGDVLEAVVLREMGSRVVVELTELGIQATWSPTSPAQVGARVRVRVTDVDARRDRLVLADVVE